jgi:hypothetical protein
LITTALPLISAGAAFQSGMAMGKFRGVMSPTTPSGLRRVVMVSAFSRAGGAAVVAVPGTKKPDTELVQLPTNLRGSPAPTGSTNIQIRYLLIRGS